MMPWLYYGKKYHQAGRAENAGVQKWLYDEIQKEKEYMNQMRTMSNTIMHLIKMLIERIKEQQVQMAKKLKNWHTRSSG